MQYGWEEVRECGYNTKAHWIVGDLRKTGCQANIFRTGIRNVYQDDNAQEWVKIRGLWWRYPQEIDL